jgi:glutamine amidotransferase
MIDLDFVIWILKFKCMIIIIDYGMGNLRSVQKAFEKFCPDVIVSSSSKHVLKADKIVLPGVGAFRNAMAELDKRGLVDPIKKSIEKGKPFLGVCLGLQLLFSESSEGGSVKGLDIIKGRVLKFDDKNGLKVPHMGWNLIRNTQYAQRTTILDGVNDSSYMYFVHSYYVQPEEREVILCETDYGIIFTSGIHRDNIYAFQFHPEKSQAAGLRIIENFARS